MEKKVEKLAELFAGRDTAYGTHGEPYQDPGKAKWEIKKSARTRREPVTPELWQKHVDGKKPLGIITIRADDTCCWGSIDVDDYENDPLEIIAKAERLKFPLVPCRSKSGGLHLFCFCRSSPASAMQAALANMVSLLGLPPSTEIFPKQTRGNGVGNWMVMPYFGDTYGGKIKEQVGLKKNGAEMTLTEFIRVAEEARLSSEQLDAWAKKKAKTNGAAAFANDSELPLPGAPLCLRKKAHEGVPDGMRNNALFAMGVYARKTQPKNWKSKLHAFNFAYLRPPLDDDEVAEIEKSLDKKDYNYPEDIVCKVCTTHGCVGRGSTNHPVFEHVEIIAGGTRTIWNIRLQGDWEISMSSNDVSSQRQFNKLCLAKFHHMFAKMNDAQWTALVNEAGGRATKIQAEEGVSELDQLQAYLEEYLTNKLRGEKKDDLFLGLGWEDEEKGVYYFRMGYFQKYLAREDPVGVFRRMSRVELGQFVRALGGGYGQLDVCGRNVRVYWVPSKAIVSTPFIEPLPPPKAPI